MKTIVVLGTGKSTVSLFDYLGKKASANGWRILACDRDPEAIKERIAPEYGIETRALDVSDKSALNALISEADLVISMLPAFMHPEIAKLCLKLRKHLATASYVSDEMAAMESEVQSSGLIFLNEAGLDPGIDHMSAMKLIDQLRSDGAETVSFESYCGGLVDERDCEGNPWKYKFSWNPRNVILAGQGGMSVFKKSGMIRYVPWHHVFAASEMLDLGATGKFDAYPNRDSLKYEKLYGMEQAETFIRGTLRRENFCRAWQVLVDLGFTDNETQIDASIDTPAALIRALTGISGNLKFADWLLETGRISRDLKGHFEFLEAESGQPVFQTEAKTAAGKLQQWLEQKWALQEHDRDEVVMHHRIGYRQNGSLHFALSTMQLKGKDHVHTAMAKTVGLPLAMGAELILNGAVSRPGIHIPVTPDWYGPVLSQLEAEGIQFTEEFL